MQLCVISYKSMIFVDYTYSIKIFLIVLYAFTLKVKITKRIVFKMTYVTQHDCSTMYHIVGSFIHPSLILVHNSSNNIPSINLYT